MYTLPPSPSLSPSLFEQIYYGTEKSVVEEFIVYSHKIPTLKEIVYYTKQKSLLKHQIFC